MYKLFCPESIIILKLSREIQRFLRAIDNSAKRTHH